MSELFTVKASHLNYTGPWSAVFWATVLTACEVDRDWQQNCNLMPGVEYCDGGEFCKDFTVNVGR